MADGAPSVRLPTVLASSVIRASQQGEAHGGLYLVNLERGSFEQVIRWDAPIDWSGRGAERGLRGIAIQGDRVYVAADREIVVYNCSFERVASFATPYLKDCHEIFATDRSLFVTSTGFDSVLEFDFERGAFVHGYCFRRRPTTWHSVRRPAWNVPALARRLLGPPHTHLAARAAQRVLRQFVSHATAATIDSFQFDPARPGGPAPGDTTHLNSVTFQDGALFVAGLRLEELLAVRDGDVQRYAHIPPGTHDARPYGDGVLFNRTRTDHVVLRALDGRVLWSCAVPSYPATALVGSDVPGEYARAGFARGLCVTDDGLVITGSSPATIAVYDLGRPDPITSVNITMDVRNAIHGLAIWPF